MFMCACMLSCLVIFDSFEIPWTVASQAPLPMGLSKQEYWNELLFPPPRDLPYPGSKPGSLKLSALAGNFFTNEPPQKPPQMFIAALFIRAKKWKQSKYPSTGKWMNKIRGALVVKCLMAENKEELKSLLMKVKEESEKAGLKLNIQKQKVMASGPITSWQIDGETMETVKDFIFLGSKITVDGDCSHEIKISFFLGRKAMTNLDSILKSRDITLWTKVHLVKAMVFPVVVYGM